MSKFSEKGYFVKENTPIYLTVDMEKAVMVLCSIWYRKWNLYI